MKLSDLLQYKDIVIQCHDNPDADALASGYALHWYFEKMGRDVPFIYRGNHAITKSNLLIMLNELEIPVSYEPDYDHVPELLVTVDCQYGQKNVTYTEAKNVAIIDHHQVTVDLPPLSEVRSNIGSCATILWSMLNEEQLDVRDDRNLCTALYYGLFTDTNALSEIAHPLDRDMADSLIYNKIVITMMRNSNISLKELKIAGEAILGYDYHEVNQYLIVQAKKCDPNILGVISDFVLETAEVNVCLAYSINPNEIKFSVRSCVKEVRADELAVVLSKGIGGGGGHRLKAGGTIRPEMIEQLFPDFEGMNDDTDDFLEAMFIDRLDEYFKSYEIIYAKTAEISTEGMKLYHKRPQRLGFVKATDLFPEKTLVSVRTLEGDVDIVIEEDVYLMIGIEGEVYPIMGEKLRKTYMDLHEPFVREFEYAPSVTSTYLGEKKHLMEYAGTCVNKGKARIYAKPLDHKIKLFTRWDEEKYYSGDPGDYLAVREDDPHDIYIIQDRLFDQLYEEVKPGNP